MALYTQSGVSVESWVEMTDKVSMRYEVDRENNRVTLFIGSGNEYVLNLGRDNLDQILVLGGAAKSELDNPPAKDQ